MAPAALEHLEPRGHCNRNDMSNVTQAELDASFHLAKSRVVRTVRIPWIEGDDNRISPAVSYVHS